MDNKTSSSSKAHSDASQSQAGFFYRPDDAPIDVFNGFDENESDDSFADDEFDYEAYERAVKEREKENAVYLAEFEEELEAAGLADKTIGRHLSNVDFFINTYLQREEALGIEEGCYRLDDFLGYFFIRKCMWSTPNTIRQNAASFKKFYKCMVKHGHVSQDAYDCMLATIKESMPLWVEDCEEFNTPSDDFDSDLFHMTYDLVARSLGLDHLLDGREPLENNSLDYDEDEEEDAPSRQDVIDDLTALLLYLGAFEQDGELRASVSMNHTALENLKEQGILKTTDDEQIVILTEAGQNQACFFLTALGVGHLA
ncbi:MAG: hypothetical protein IJ125_06820 [Atopobiaceae bacterium]|nr:hypothetical protein [Atopobiaceae bacterium]